MKRTWSVSWDSAASDGTQWHAGLRSGQLEGHKARSLADLSLHRHDISFCDRLLKEYAPSFRGDYDDLSRALWVAVLTKFVGCFRDWRHAACFGRKRSMRPTPRRCRILNLFWL